MWEDPANVTAAAVELLVLAVAIGVVASELWVLPHDSDIGPHPALPAIRARMWTLLGLCLIGLAGTSVAGLMLRTASMSELPVWAAFPALGTVLLKTHYGLLWLWRAAALLVLIAIWAWRWRNISSRITPAVIFIVLVTTLYITSVSGHAGDDGLLSVMSVANAIHIVGGLIWGGGIIVAALIIFPALCRTQPLRHDLLAEASLRLSTLSGVALAMVLLPGVYDAWLLIGSWPALWTSTYGQTLAVKVVFAAAMIGLGAINRYVYVPALQRAAHRPEPRMWLPVAHPIRLGEGAVIRRFVRSLWLEGILLVGVLLFAASLSQQSPPAHADHDTMVNSDSPHEMGP